MYQEESAREVKYEFVEWNYFRLLDTLHLAIYLDEFRESCSVYKNSARPTRNLVLPTLRYIFAQKFFPCWYTNFQFVTFCFIQTMIDEIRPVTVGAAVDVAMNATVRKGENENDELVSH